MSTVTIDFCRQYSWKYLSINFNDNGKRKHEWTKVCNYIINGLRSPNKLQIKSPNKDFQSNTCKDKKTNYLSNIKIMIVSVSLPTITGGDKCIEWHVA